MKASVAQLSWGDWQQFTWPEDLFLYAMLFTGNNHRKNIWM